ncbi:MAG: hypothetical protein HY811_10335 [Planctomycetes bacterium]|nr:hypothetical protein [Planctomycetota bacterium]
MSKTAARNLNSEFAIRNSVCPPLTTDDIFTLRGKPMVKCIEPAKNLNLPVERRNQKWVYVSLHTNNEEHYFFKDGYLVGWKRMSL